METYFINCDSLIWQLLVMRELYSFLKEGCIEDYHLMVIRLLEYFSKKVWSKSHCHWLSNYLVFHLFFFFSFFILFFYFTILYWFYHTLTWIHHRCTWVPNPEPPSHLPPHIISLGHPSAPAPSILYPVSCIEPRLMIRFLHDSIHVSMPFSLIIPPSPSPTESKRLFYTSVSLLLSCIQGYHYHLSKFHIYV